MLRVMTENPPAELVNRNNMFDLKILKRALTKLPKKKASVRKKILEAVESKAIAAAYRKEYGKKGEAIKAKLDLKTGDLNFGS